MRKDFETITKNQELPDIRARAAGDEPRVVARVFGKPGGVKTANSAVTNGKRQFVIGDGRSPWARRQRDLAEMHVQECVGPGEIPTQAQMSLCLRAATIECELEAAEGQLSLGKPTDLALYVSLTGLLRRVFEALGATKTRPHTVTRTFGGRTPFDRFVGPSRR